MEGFWSQRRNGTLSPYLHQQPPFHRGTVWKSASAVTADTAITLSMVTVSRKEVPEAGCSMLSPSMPWLATVTSSRSVYSWKILPKNWEISQRNTRFNQLRNNRFNLSRNIRYNHLKLGEKGGKYIFRIYRLFFMGDASEPNLSLGGSSFQPFTIAIPDKRFTDWDLFLLRSNFDG